MSSLLPLPSQNLDHNLAERAIPPQNCHWPRLLSTQSMIHDSMLGCMYSTASRSVHKSKKCELDALQAPSPSSRRWGAQHWGRHRSRGGRRHRRRPGRPMHAGPRTSPHNSPGCRTPARHQPIPSAPGLRKNARSGIKFMHTALIWCPLHYLSCRGFLRNLCNSSSCKDSDKSACLAYASLAVRDEWCLCKAAPFWPAGAHLEGDGDTLQEDGLSGPAFPAAGVLLKLAAADALCLDDTARAALLAFAGNLSFLSERACMGSLTLRRRSGPHLNKQLHRRSTLCGAQAAAQHCKLPSWRVPRAFAWRQQHQAKLTADCIRADSACKEVQLMIEMTGGSSAPTAGSPLLRMGPCRDWK